LRIALAEVQQTLLANEMAHCLHAAGTTDELYRIAECFMPQLFPGKSGSLWVMDPSGKVIKKTATWGSRPTGDLVLPADACFALPTGRKRRARSLQASRVCSHASGDSESSRICLPLMIQSTRLGVLHLRGPACPGELFAQNEMRLVRSVAAEIGLSLANVQLRDSLRHQAFRDPLTGLYNRRFLHETLELELRRAKRKGSSIALVMIDIDSFKLFNDTYGHAAGDSLIRKVAESLQSSVRSNDILCRYGGDEFSLVMPEASIKDVVLWAKRRKSGAKRLGFEWGGRTLPFPTVSLGVAAYPAFLTLDALFREADSMLYVAKAGGRDQLKWR
jgi:diguanylate cyclase (GGDEF)-like protein